MGSKKYIGPELKIIRMNGNDIITSSGEDYEGEITPITPSEDSEN